MQLRKVENLMIAVAVIIVISLVALVIYTTGT